MIPIHPFTPQSISAVAVEVQVLDADHCLHELPPHGHAFFELMLITAGRGVHRVDGRAFEAVPGTLFVLAPGATHDGRELASARGWLALFDGDAVGGEERGGVAHEAGAPSRERWPSSRWRATSGPIRLADEAFRRIANGFERIDRELAERGPDYPAAVRAALHLLLVDVGRCVGPARPTRAAQASPAQRDAVRRIFADIDRHFASASSLSMASRRLGMNAAYLTTLLRRTTGRTYGAWTIERRMSEARKLLTGTRMRVADVADRVGYAEVESFARRFRVHHGVTPSSWRREAESADREIADSER